MASQIPQRHWLKKLSFPRCVVLIYDGWLGWAWNHIGGTHHTCEGVSRLANWGGKPHPNILIPNIKLFLVRFQGTTIRKVTNTRIFMGEKQKELNDGGKWCHTWPIEVAVNSEALHTTGDGKGQNTVTNSRDILLLHMLLGSYCRKGISILGRKARVENQSVCVSVALG